MNIVCIDGPKKGRVYWFPADMREFQVNSLVPGSVEDAYYGGRLSGYGGYIYQIGVMWGTWIPVAWFDRLAYK